MYCIICLSCVCLKYRYVITAALRIFSQSRGVSSICLPCCCCCSHINSHNRVRGHRTGSSHFGAEEYPEKKIKRTKSGTRIHHSWSKSYICQKICKWNQKSGYVRIRPILVYAFQDLQLKPTKTACHQENQTMYKSEEKQIKVVGKKEK